MPDIDVQRLLDATRRRSRQLRARRLALVGSVAVVVGAAIAVPAAVLSTGKTGQGVIVSPGPSTSTTSVKQIPPPSPEGPTTVPDVIGEVYLPTANMAVANANLVSQYRLEHNESVRAGTVISQEPPPGSVVASETTVTMVVSLGPSNIAGANPCKAKDLSAQPGEPVSQATGQNAVDWSFTNNGGPCVLDGYPVVSALNTKGHVLGFGYTHSGDQMTTGAAPQPVYLPNGSSAWVRVNKYRCDIQPTDTASVLRLTLPSGGGTLELPTTYQYCQETPSLTIAVSPFESVEMLLWPGTNAPGGPLAVQLTASPNPVSPGHALSYTITVTNLGTTPLSGVATRLALPEYVQWVSWSPNCQGQGPTFICTFGGKSTSPPPGPQAQLQPGQSQSASITVTVNASPTVPSFSATVTASATTTTGPVTATATDTATES